jgi:recombination protein RecR
MEYFPAALEKLVEQFARLPGIGSKSAQRLAFFVLSLPEEEAKAFADAIVDAKRTVTFCPVCIRRICANSSSVSENGTIFSTVSSGKSCCALSSRLSSAFISMISGRLK